MSNTVNTFTLRPKAKFT